MKTPWPRLSKPLAPGLKERERVLDVLRQHEPELRARGLTRLALFGSMARGDADRRATSIC